MLVLIVSGPQENGAIKHFNKSLELNSNMKSFAISFVFIFLFVASPCHAGFFDDLIEKAPELKELSRGSNTGSESSGLASLLDNDTAISGLKEALEVGIRNAVANSSKLDGFLSNENIKIPMPDSLQKVASVLKSAGYGQMTEDFELSMNRAAEEAAPKAEAIFIDAIKGASIEDAQKILKGGDTAATDYLKEKTFQSLSDLFSPIINSSLDKVGATRYYKEMMAQFASLPFMNAFAFDLNQYVTKNSLDGLFFMVGEEEKKIRENPTARVTDLLKKVFENQ